MTNERLLFSDVTGPKMDQLGLTLAHCTVSLQSSVGYTEVYHINTTDRYERRKGLFCCVVKAIERLK